MLIKAKPPSLIFLLILLFLSNGLQFSLGYEVPYPKTEKERCLERCDEAETELSGMVRCAIRCERQYGDKENDREGEETRDPKSPRWEIERCQQSCRREETEQREQLKCQQRCEEEVIKERQREQEKGQERQPREHEIEREKRDEPRKQYEQCLDSCERQEGRQKQECKRKCERQYLEQEERQHGRDRGNSDRETKSREIEQQKNNPYYFHAKRLQSRFKTEEGHIRVLEKFSESSELLRGIENYRLILLDANPNTFVVPCHFDAQSLVVVLNGKGTISYVLQDKRESYNLETGDVIKIPAGAIIYMSNHDNNEILSLANLVQPVNIPGGFSDFSASGGQNFESYYRVFSNDVLEAALNTPRDQLDKLFGQQRQGVILKAPQKQLKALSQRVSSRRQKGQGPFNLLNQQPLHSNRYGNLMEASPNDYKQLQDMDISVAYAEIKRGSLMIPHYNSRSTTIVLVVEGSGRVEMACPHVAKQSRKEWEGRREQEANRGTEHYQKITSNLSPGDVFIMPAGHPTAYLASQNENLLMLGFGINAWDNHRNFLAGQKDNVMNQIEREAHELSFNAPAELIEKIVRNQKESHFVAGPRQQREEGRGHSIHSILDFPGFF